MNLGYYLNWVAMKVRVVGFIALAILQLFAAKAVAGQIRASWQAGGTGATRLSPSFASPPAFRAGFGRHGFHLSLGSRLHPHSSFGHREHLKHELVLGPHHHFGHQGVLFHHPFGFHGRLIVGQRVIHVSHPLVIIWSRRAVATPVMHEEISREVREWLRRGREHFFIERPPHEGPLISFMLHHREELGLSADQVKALEQLRDDFQREAIRKEADLRISEMDLARLLDAEPVDLELVKAKLEEIERLRAELRHARIRTIEQGKALLSSEQRAKLQALTGPRKRISEIPSIRKYEDPDMRQFPLPSLFGPRAAGTTEDDSEP